MLVPRPLRQLAALMVARADEAQPPRCCVHSKGAVQPRCCRSPVPRSDETESVGGSALVEPFTIENGCSPKTLKQRRDSDRQSRSEAIESRITAVDPLTAALTH